MKRSDAEREIRTVNKKLEEGMGELKQIRAAVSDTMLKQTLAQVVTELDMIVATLDDATP